MKMTTMNIDAFRNELAREILQTDNIEVLNKLRQAFHRISKRVESKAVVATPSIGPHTREEMLARINESEADEAAGRMSDSEDVFARIDPKCLALGIK